MLYTLIDIETTGLSTSASEILEVGYMRVKKNLDIVGYGQFCFYDSKWQIENRAQQVHGLARNYLLEQCPDRDMFNENLVKLYTLIEHGVIIGKNSNAFDIPLIQSFLRRNIDSFSEAEIAGVLDMQDVYTSKYQEFYAEKYGVATKKKGKLGELVEMIGYTQDEVQALYSADLPGEGRARAHGALYDTYMTYLLLKYAVQNYGIKI